MGLERQWAESRSRRAATPQVLLTFSAAHRDQTASLITIALDPDDLHLDPDNPPAERETSTLLQSRLERPQLL